jgi:hypothetical protein
MSIALESVKRINALKNSIEAVTGESYEDLTEGIQALKNGYGQGGESDFPLGEVTDFSGFFQSGRRMEVFNKIDTKSATNMYQFCYQNSQITEPPIINTSNVVSMEEAFNECNLMKSPPISGRDKDGNIIPLDTKNVENFRMAFRACRNMEGEIYLDTQNATSLYQTFTACQKITKITFTDTSKSNEWFATFNSCSALKTIENLTMLSTNSNTFTGCTSLENVTFGKVFISEQNLVPNFNVTNLSRDSIYSLVNALEPNTGDVITIALGNCLSKLSSDEKNEVKNIATSKGFNLT